MFSFSTVRTQFGGDFLHFGKGSFCIALLLILFLLFPVLSAEAADQSAFHSLSAKAADIGADPAQAITADLISALLEDPTLKGSEPLQLGEFCSLLCNYLHTHKLVLPVMRTDDPALPSVIPHRADILQCYTGGILGASVTEYDLSDPVNVAQGCLILSDFLSHAADPLYQQPVSTLLYDENAGVDSLADSLIMGHSNVVGLFLSVDSPWSYAARDGLSTYDYLSSTDLILGDYRYGMAKDALIEQQYRVIYIMLGTNDLADGDWALSTYRKQLANLIEVVEYYQPKSRICLIGISPVGFESERVPDRFSQSNIRAYNEVQKSLSRDYSANYLDIFSVLADEAGYNQPAISRRDGIHYSVEGYEIILKEIYTHPVR